MAIYTVKKGDTLSAIAKQYGTTYQEIAKANGISDPNKISVGQKLTIGGSTSGNKTAAASTKTPTSDTQQKTPAAAPSTGAFQYQNYQESDAVKQAQALLNQQLAQKPGEYESQWQAQLDDTIQKILNREKFSYDVNVDALYQQ